MRDAAVAGSFYPADRRSLNGLVESLIASVRPVPLESPPSILLVPHAGYPFSGQTAAHAYKSIKGISYDIIVMVGPSHHVYLDGAAVYTGDYWKTPLGTVPVDVDTALKIVELCTHANANAVAHTQEHSLEVQVPFLQTVLDDFSIVPIVTLSRSVDEAGILARSIVEACSGKKWLLIASSDLYHGNSYEECVAVTDTTVKAILKGDPEEMAGSFAAGHSSACGEGAILTALNCAGLLDTSPVLLHQTNSGDVMGSRSGYVVGYCSVAFVSAGGSSADRH